jgi:hypothetical protein
VKIETNRLRLIPLVVILFAIPLAGQGKITTPKEQFGFSIGDDYQLANYVQLQNYWRKLAEESPRLKLVEIGKTAEGRPMTMAVITSPENHKRIARFKDIARRLALAEEIDEQDAKSLAREGRAVVWIDGGLHATEVLGAQHIIELVYQMVSLNDPESLRFLDDVVLLVACANPDGMDLVSDWYMRESEPAKRSMAGIPRLYQKYIGHDNNRDFYISNMPETEAINRVFYHEWFPQIVYNHHQSGPPGTVLFAPPFRDPFNYNLDPLVPMGIDLVSAAMHNRFVAEGKPGATMRSGANYSTWWNGGLRSMVYFHNMIGLLTEAIGNPTPMTIPFVPQNQLPRGDLPFPIAPQRWHFRQSIEYAITADRAVLDVASKYREEFLFNIYRMGRNAIERGNRDSWTIHPKVIASVQEAIAKEREASGTEREAGSGGRAAGFARPTAPAKFYEMLRDPAQRDPRGYVIPCDQPDFLTATKFVNALIKAGITVHRANRDFQIAGKSYPADSYIVKAAQAFRPHILDMFEPQDHPDDIPYPGGPPRPPYDSAGWTLAYQMGVQFDRIVEGFEAPSEKIAGFAKFPVGKVNAAGKTAGFLLSHAVNDSFIAMNRLIASGEQAYWLKSTIAANGRSYPPGTVFVPAQPATRPKIEKLATELGLNFDGTMAQPQGPALKLKPLRVGLWDRYGGSMPSGWVRWLLEKFEFPFEVVYAPQLDAGSLAGRYDVLIFVSGAIPPASRSGEGEFRPPDSGDFRPMEDPSRLNIPAEYKDRLGSVSIAKTVPELRKFVEEGGTLLAIGSSTGIGNLCGLPITSALTEKAAGGVERPLTREKFFIPGSLLRVRIDTSNPLAFGFNDYADVFYENSPAFRLGAEATLRGVRPIAWFEGKKVLRSGWAWGEAYLDQAIAIVEAGLGKGRIVLFGPEITFRAQPHGTFKFLFNGIYLSNSEAVVLGPKG